MSKIEKLERTGELNFFSIIDKLDEIIDALNELSSSIKPEYPTNKQLDQYNNPTLGATATSQPPKTPTMIADEVWERHVKTPTEETDWEKEFNEEFTIFFEPPVQRIWRIAVTPQGIKTFIRNLLSQQREEMKKQVESILVECEKDVEYASERGHDCSVRGEARAKIILSQLNLKS